MKTWAFFGKTMKYVFIAFFVQRTQVLLFNFMKNPFCYFSISISYSKRPITSIIFKNVQKCCQTVLLDVNF